MALDYLQASKLTSRLKNQGKEARSPGTETKASRTLPVIKYSTKILHGTLLLYCLVFVAKGLFYVLIGSWAFVATRKVVEIVPPHLPDPKRSRTSLARISPQDGSMCMIKLRLLTRCGGCEDTRLFFRKFSDDGKDIPPGMQAFKRSPVIKHWAKFLLEKFLFCCLVASRDDHPVQPPVHASL
jgi:hypothetical protein